MALGQMICETCHGKGMVTLYKRPLWPPQPVTGLCPTCGGCGFSHCCDADQVQPEPKLIEAKVEAK